MRKSSRRRHNIPMIDCMRAGVSNGVIYEVTVSDDHGVNVSR